MTGGFANETFVWSNGYELLNQRVSRMKRNNFVLIIPKIVANILGIIVFQNDFLCVGGALKDSEH